MLALYIRRARQVAGPPSGPKGSEGVPGGRVPSAKRREQTCSKPAIAASAASASAPASGGVLRDGESIPTSGDEPGSRGEPTSSLKAGLFSPGAPVFTCAARSTSSLEPEARASVTGAGRARGAASDVASCSDSLPGLLTVQYLVVEGGQ